MRENRTQGSARGLLGNWQSYLDEVKETALGKELNRIKRRRVTQRRMDDIWQHRSSSVVVHYSCESFYDREDGNTPRVTSIAVRNLESGQTESFSMHKVAELNRVPFDQIQKDYDELEKQMLSCYFDFARTHQHFNWIHWNMRDINYGFAALEHRFRVLGGEPIVISEDRKFDLARALVSKYGVGYIGHPRLHKLVMKNKMANKSFLSGEEEAKAFREKEYIKLHQSTLRKADILANVFERVVDSSIKTNAKWYEKYGAHPKVVIEIARKHWIWTIIVAIGILLGIIVNLIDML